MAQAVATDAIASGKLQRGDVDEDVLGFLRIVPVPMAEQVIKDFMDADLTGVKSRPGYLLGMLPHRLRKSRRGSNEDPAEKQRRAEAAAAKRKPAAEAPDEVAPPVKKPKKAVANGVAHLLFCNQLPYSCTQAQIAEHFAPSAGVPATELATKCAWSKEGKFCGTAFVDMPDVASMEAALALDQSFLKGRKINVRPSLTRSSCWISSWPKPREHRLVLERRARRTRALWHAREIWRGGRRQ